MKRRGNIKKTIRNTILTLSCITSIVVTGIFAAQMYAEYRSSENMKKVQQMATVKASAAPLQENQSPDEVSEEKSNLVALKMQYLSKKNNDLCGWLRVQGTDIDYPIMFREDDNDYYLKHDFFGNEDRNGLLVLDKRCSSDMSDNHLLIHGHNMKSGAIFGTLKYYKDEEYLESHKVLELDTSGDQRFFEIIAVVDTSVSGDHGFSYADYIRLDDRDTYDNYVSNIKDRSMHKIPAYPTFGDQLLTLSTCDYTTKNGRLLIVARRVG